MTNRLFKPFGNVTPIKLLKEKVYILPFAINNIASKEDMRKSKENIGRAYFFFDSEAPKDKITSELDRVIKHPSYSERLKLSLIEGVGNLKGYWDLKALAAESRQAQRKYVLEGTHLDVTNREVAEELKEIMGSTLSLNLYDEKGKFRGDIYYKEKRKYIPLKERKTF